MSKKLLMVVAVLAMSVSGCGKKAKADLETVLTALESVGKAAAKPASPKSALQPGGSRVRRVMAEEAGLAPGSNPWGEGDSDDYFGHACKTVSPVGYSSSMVIEVSGADCPFEYKMSIEQRNQGVDLEIRYVGRAPEVKQASDVDSLDLKLSVDVSKDGNSGKAHLVLNANSQKYGKVTYDLTGTASMNNGRLTQTLEGEITVGDKTADISVKAVQVDGRTTNEVEINGEKLTQEQLARISEAFPSSR